MGYDHVHFQSLEKAETLLLLWSISRTLQHYL